MGGSKDKGTCFTLSHSWDTTPKVCLSWSATITKHFNAYLTILPFLFAHSFLGSAWRCFLSVSGLMLKRFQVNFQRGFKISEDCILAQKIGNHDGWQWKTPFLHTGPVSKHEKTSWKNNAQLETRGRSYWCPSAELDSPTTDHWPWKKERMRISVYTNRCVCACTCIHTYTSHTILGCDIKSLYHSACPIICLV